MSMVRGFLFRRSGECRESEGDDSRLRWAQQQGEDQMLRASRGPETSGTDKIYKFAQGGCYDMLQKKVKQQEEIAGLQRLSRLQACLALGSNLVAMSFRVGAVLRPPVPAVQRTSVVLTLQALREEASVCTVQFI